MEELKYFFSYARNDSEFVLKLAKELRAVGANLWLDQLDILGGQHWDSTVEKALKSCKGMMAVLSPESVASDNVMDEVSYALNEGKLVVPVLIRPCNIPYRLQRVQYIDFTADYDTGFSQLLRALGIEQPVQPLESTAAQEPVVRDSTEPLEEKPTEPLILKKQAAQEVEKPIPDEIDHPKPTGLETEKAWSKSQKTKVIAAICIVTLITIISIVVFLFRPKTYSLIASADPNGSISPSVTTTVTYGGDMTFTAKPDEGYQVDTWSVDEKPVPEKGTTYTLSNIRSNHKVNVTFRWLEYEVTVTAEPNGSVTKDPDKTSYNHGDEVILKAVPNEGYVFSNWSGDLDGSTNPATLVMDADKTVTAHFVKTYSLTATAINGEVTKSPNQPGYKHGDEVTLKAIPNEGYVFSNWSGDLSGSTNPATVEMYADKSVTASFALKTYSLTATADPNGSITKDPDKTSYNHGDEVTLKAVPNEGYVFSNWSGNLDGSTNPAMLEIYADKSVTASFALKTYSLTTTADPNGSVTKDPDKTSYNHGDEVTLKAVPNEGYVFSNWSGDLDGSTNPATLVMDADKTMTAHFVKTYSLDILHAVGGSVTKDPNQVSYEHGDEVTLKAVPNEGYVFSNWSGDLSGSTNPATLEMYADKSVTARFGLNVVTNSIGMKLVYIPAGSFMMGNSSSAKQLAGKYNRPEGHFTDEFPQHQVRISEGFWIGQTEVTQGQYKSVMNAQPWSGKLGVKESSNDPAVYVSWDDAVEFCRKLSQQDGKTYRLPTEAEWEYACRAGTTTRFSFGDNHKLLGDYAWFLGNTSAVGEEYAQPVRKKKPNPWGLYDMHGNVWEWCSDWYAKDYYSKSLSVDPKGPSSGTTRRSLRSGSWSNSEYDLRCSQRTACNSAFRHYNNGFRVVRSQ